MSGCSLHTIMWVATVFNFHLLVACTASYQHLASIEEWLLCAAHVFYQSCTRVFNLLKFVYYHQEEELNPNFCCISCTAQSVQGSKLV